MAGTGGPVIIPVTAELDSIELPCAVCVYDAVKQGVDYAQLPEDAKIVGSKYGDGKEIHQTVTTFAGTDVCWYHIVELAEGLGFHGVRV